jgi:hypothetical protein
VTGLANQTISFFLPDAGNARLSIQNSPPSVRLNYPIPEPITVRSFAAFLSDSNSGGGLIVPAGATVFFRLLRNNFSILSISFGVGEGAVPKFVSFPPQTFAAGDLITVQCETDNYPDASATTVIASATVGLA